MTKTLFKSTVILTLSLFTLAFQGCGDDDESEPIGAGEFIRLTVVDPRSESVTLQNFSTGTVDVSNYQLCLGPGQYNALSNYTTVTGDLNITANGTITIDLASGSENVTALPDTNGALGLFATSGRFDSTDPNIFKDFIQWGGANQNRVEQATTATRWDDISNFVDGFAPYTYTGGAEDAGASFWTTNAPENVRLTSGFIINAQTPNGSNIVKYFSTLPDGNVDLSNGTDFQQFFPVDLFDAAIYNARPDGSAGFAKIMVNGNEEIIEDSFIPTVDETSFQIAVRDATTGIFHDRNFPNQITVFNPTTMTVDGTIDMSAGFVPDNDIVPRYQTFYFRNDEIFGPLRGNAGPAYDSLVVHVADVSTGNYTTTTSFNSGIAFPINDFGQNDLDENGNLYIPHQGDVFTFSPGKLHRIPAGSNQFDPDYDFNIAGTLNPANVFLPTFRGFRYIENDMAIALVAEDSPQALLDLVASVGGNPANLSDDQVQQALGILFASENGRWCTIDLNTQTVSIIPGLPAQSVFATSVVMEDNGLLYLPITTPSINSLYSYDPVTGATEKVFDLTAGGALVGVYNLSRNN